MSTCLLACRQSVFKWQQSNKHSKRFTYKMAAKTSWHRYGTKSLPPYLFIVELSNSVMILNFWDVRWKSHVWNFHNSPEKVINISTAVITVWNQRITCLFLQTSNLWENRELWTLRVVDCFTACLIGFLAHYHNFKHFLETVALWNRCILSLGQMDGNVCWTRAEFFLPQHSRNAPVFQRVCCFATTSQTNRRTDGRTPDRCFTLYATGAASAVKWTHLYRE